MLERSMRNRRLWYILCCINWPSKYQWKNVNISQWTHARPKLSYRIPVEKICFTLNNCRQLYTYMYRFLFENDWSHSFNRILKRQSLHIWTVFEIVYFVFKSFVKVEFKLGFHNKSVHYSWKLHGKVNYLLKQVCFSLVGNYLRPSNN